MRPATGCLLILLLAFLAAANLEAQDAVYIDASAGSDQNPGTLAQPLATLQACVDLWSGARWVHCLGRGVFSEEVTIENGGPSASQRNKISAWDSDGDGRLDDEVFTLDGRNRLSHAISSSRAPKPDNVEISWLTIEDFAPDVGCSKGSARFIEIPYGAGGADWWIHHNHLRRLAVGCDWEDSGEIIAVSPSGAPRMLIEHNTIEDIGGYVMRYFDGPDIKVRFNSIEIDSVGIKAWGPALDRLEVTDNEFRCDGNGREPNSDGCAVQFAVAFTNDAQDGVIARNRFSDCVVSVLFATNESFGTRDNANHLVESNLMESGNKVCNPWEPHLMVSDCSGPSGETGANIEVRNLRVQNNVFSDRTGRRQGGAIRLASGHPHEFHNDIEITHNTFDGGRWGLRLDRCENGGFTKTLRGVDVRNNIFSDLDALYSLTLGGWGNQRPRDFRSDSNAIAPGLRVYWPDENTIGDWRSAFGQDVESRVCSPSFQNEETLRLHALDTCAVDRGVGGLGVGRDYDGDGRPQGAGFDIGADEVCQPGGCSCLFCDSFESGGREAWH